MANKIATCEIKGVAHLIVHNGQLADPLNEWAKALKKVSGKRNKTDADHEKMAELEFRGGLYLNAEGKAIIPGKCIEGMLVKGANHSKRGKVIKSFVFTMLEEWPLIYTGPHSVDELWADTKFRRRDLVVIKGARIMRTRPTFTDWKLKFELCFDDTGINPEALQEILELAGRITGLGDWRPKHGRFTVEKFDVRDA